MSQKSIVAMLLKRGAAVDLPNAVGGTALMLAAENGNVGIVWQLLRAGADPDALNEHQMKALQHAVTRQHRMTASLLRRATSTDPVAAKSAAPADPELFVGRLVAIHGLPELNGRRGKAASYDAVKGCIDVLLEGGSRVVMVKPANLELVDAETPKAAAGPKEIASGDDVLAPRKGQATAVGRRGVLAFLLPSREQLHARRSTVSLTTSRSPHAKEEEALPAGVLLAAFLGQPRAVRAWLDQGGRVDARAQGRAGGEWTLLMAAAEGGRDGRRRYEEHVAAYRQEQQHLAHSQVREAAATKAAEEATAAEAAARQAEQRARFAQAYATPTAAPASAPRLEATAAAAEAAASAAAAAPSQQDIGTVAPHPTAPAASAPAPEMAAADPVELPSAAAASSVAAAAAPEPPRPLEPMLSDKIIASTVANRTRRSDADRQSPGSGMSLMENLTGSFSRFATALLAGGGGSGGSADGDMDGDEPCKKGSPRRARSGDLDAAREGSFPRRASGDANSPRDSKPDTDQDLSEPVGRGKRLASAREAIKLAEAEAANLTPSLDVDERVARLARAREKVAAAEAKRAAAEEALRLTREMEPPVTPDLRAVDNRSQGSSSRSEADYRT